MARHTHVLRYLVAAGLVVAVLYLVFELGRYQAGFSLFDQRLIRDEMASEVAARDAEIDRLERQQAILETSGEIDAETYAAVETQMAELQERIQGLEEEVAFYQGIVSPGDGESGLRVQKVELFRGTALDRYELRIRLVQSIVHTDRVAGVVQIAVSGNSESGAGTIELHGPGDGLAEIPYGFRYFQDLEQEIALPDGFRPEQVTIEIRPRLPEGDPLIQVFPWVEGAGG